MSENEAIYKAVKAAAGDFPVAYPNSGYPKEGQPADIPYYKVDILPASENSLGLSFSSATRQLGIIQVSCYIRDGKGDIPAVEMADQIIAAFPRGTVLEDGGVSVRIEDKAYKSQGFSATTSNVGGEKVNGGWFMIPVTIPYIIIN